MKDGVKKIRHGISGVASAINLLSNTMNGDESLSPKLRELASVSAKRLEEILAEIDALLQGEPNADPRN